MDNSENNSYRNFLSKILFDSVKKRFENILENNDLQCATVLHPKFKFKFFEKYVPDIIIKSSNSNNNVESQSSLSSSSSATFWDSDKEENNEISSEFDSLYNSFTSIDCLKMKKFKPLKELFLEYNSAMP